MSTSIKVDQVSMMFNMSSEKVDNIKEYFIRVLKHKIAVEPFWALQDVSFELKRGDSLGVIGLNGSGKSTLLKLVSGILKPTKGTVETYGSIAPLIELGAGFDPELSAVENIYLNGAVLGYSHAYMEERVDSILDFAELEEFRNIAIKNFSSGMTARLGFAIATMRKREQLERQMLALRIARMLNAARAAAMPLALRHEQRDETAHVRRPIGIGKRKRRAEIRHAHQAHALNSARQGECATLVHKPAHSLILANVSFRRAAAMLLPEAS